MQQRLFEITYLLTEQGSVTARELAERFGVSRRTIYRDIDALSLAGIPVYSEKGRGGGIRMLPEFVLDKSLFSREEQAQLVSHFQSLSSIGTPDVDSVLDKLAALFGRGDSWLEVDFSPWDGGEATRELFRMFRDAISSHSVVLFMYTGASGIEAARQVEPLRVVFRGQSWYLYAYCRAREDYRFFKLTRIKEAQLTGAHFSPHAVPPQNSNARLYENTLLDVLLRFEAAAAFRVYDEFPAASVERHPDGSFLVIASYPQSDWLIGYLLSFGPSVEVLKPLQLRTEIHAKLQETTVLYADG